MRDSSAKSGTLPCFKATDVNALSQSGATAASQSASGKGGDEKKLKKACDSSNTHTQNLCRCCVNFFCVCGVGSQRLVSHSECDTKRTVSTLLLWD